MAELWIYFFGGACTLHSGLALARLLRAEPAPGLRARDASGRARVLRPERRRERRGRRVVDQRGAAAQGGGRDYSSSVASCTTARLRPERLAA